MPISVEIHVFTVDLEYCFMLSSHSLILFEYFEMVDIFQEAGLPLWLRPYEVLVTSSYTALIETIPDTVNYCFFLDNLSVLYSLRIFVTAVLIVVLQASIHSIKSRFPNITSLREFYVAKYQENSPTFKLAQVKIVMRKKSL